MRGLPPAVIGVPRVVLGPADRREEQQLIAAVERLQRELALGAQLEQQRAVGLHRGLEDLGGADGVLRLLERREDLRDRSARLAGSGRRAREPPRVRSRMAGWSGAPAGGRCGWEAQAARSSSEHE